MRKTYEATKKAVKDVFKTAAEDVGNDVHDLNQKVIIPSVQLGQNRFVSAFIGGKAGFVVGGVVAGPVGMVHGILAGAFIGAVAGPAAMSKVEKWITPSPAPEPANQNADIPAAKSKPGSDPAP